MSEVTTPETQATGMSALALAWHLGVMIGCGIGGFLSYSSWLPFGNSYVLPLYLVSFLLLVNFAVMYF